MGLEHNVWLKFTVIDALYFYICETMLTGWSDIGYNFLIGGDGRVYEGRGWGRVGAHTYGYNSASVAFSFIGNAQDVSPSAAALQAFNDLNACSVSNGVSSHTLWFVYYVYAIASLRISIYP